MLQVGATEEEEEEEARMGSQSSVRKVSSLPRKHKPLDRKGTYVSLQCVDDMQFMFQPIFCCSAV
jgi:hypothetical protein